MCVILDGAYTCSQHETSKTMEGTLGLALAELMSTTSHINKYVLLKLATTPVPVALILCKVTCTKQPPNYIVPRSHDDHQLYLFYNDMLLTFTSGWAPRPLPIGFTSASAVCIAEDVVPIAGVASCWSNCGGRELHSTTDWIMQATTIKTCMKNAFTVSCVAAK